MMLLFFVAPLPCKNPSGQRYFPEGHYSKAPTLNIQRTHRHGILPPGRYGIQADCPGSGQGPVHHFQRNAKSFQGDGKRYLFMNRPCEIVRDKTLHACHPERSRRMCIFYTVYKETDPSAGFACLLPRFRYFSCFFHIIPL